MTELERLQQKYNAFYKRGYKGSYNDDNGANSHAPELGDARAFKKKIGDIIRAEFPGLKFKISASFAGWSEKCEITIKTTPEEAYRDFAEVAKEEEEQPCERIITIATRHSYGIAGRPGIRPDWWKKLYYNEVIRKEGRITGNGTENNYLKGRIRLAVDFLELLLQSYSYDHSDVYTDYFSSGLSGRVYLDTGKKDEAKETQRLIDGSKTWEEMADKLGGRIEGLTEEEKKAINEGAENFRRRMEEENRKREEENERQREAGRKAREELEKATEAAEVEDLETPEIVRARFSTWNKPGTLWEGLRNCEEHPEDVEAKIVRVVRFRTAEDFIAWAGQTLRDTPRIYDRKDGSGYLGGMGYLNPDGTEAPDEVQGALYYGRQKLGSYRPYRIAVKVTAPGYSPALVDPEGFQYARYIGRLAE